MRKMPAPRDRDLPGKLAIAVDLGGTWIRAAYVAEDGSHGDVVKVPTLRDRVPEDILSDIAQSIEQAAAGAPRSPQGIAIGIPSVVDRRGGFMANDNLPTMGGYGLGPALSRRCGIPVTLANDADCFTVGELRFGAARGLKNVCGITLGTGIGCGVVMEGRLHTGSHGFAGEIWKSPVGEGTLEDLTCGKSVAVLYERLSGIALEAAEIARLAGNGDEMAKEVFGQFGNELGRGISFLVNALDPDAVVFGGSVALSFPLFLPTLAAAVEKHTVAGHEVSLLASTLGDWAALLGAADLAFEQGR